MSVFRCCEKAKLGIGGDDGKGEREFGKEKGRRFLEILLQLLKNAVNSSSMNGNSHVANDSSSLGIAHLLIENQQGFQEVKKEIGFYSSKTTSCIFKCFINVYNYFKIASYLYNTQSSIKINARLLEQVGINIYDQFQISPQTVQPKIKEEAMDANVHEISLPNHIKCTGLIHTERVQVYQIDNQAIPGGKEMVQDDNHVLTRNKLKIQSITIDNALAAFRMLNALEENLDLASIEPSKEEIEEAKVRIDAYIAEVGCRTQILERLFPELKDNPNWNDSIGNSATNDFDHYLHRALSMSQGDSNGNESTNTLASYLAQHHPIFTHTDLISYIPLFITDQEQCRLLDKIFESITPAVTFDELETLLDNNPKLTSYIQQTADSKDELGIWKDFWRTFKERLKELHFDFAQPRSYREWMDQIVHKIPWTINNEIEQQHNELNFYASNHHTDRSLEQAQYMQYEENRQALQLQQELQKEQAEIQKMLKQDTLK